MNDPSLLPHYRLLMVETGRSRTLQLTILRSFHSIGTMVRWRQRLVRSVESWKCDPRDHSNVQLGGESCEQYG